MKKLKSLVKDFFNDESAQGATEYILLLVVVVGIAMVFRERIQSIVREKIDELAGNIQGFSN